MKTLTIEHIKNLSLRELVSLYIQGYRLNEQQYKLNEQQYNITSEIYPNINDIIPYSKNTKYRFV